MNTNQTTKAEELAKTSAADARIMLMRKKLIRMQIGGCNCNTKTPDIQYHAEDCRYRLAVEVDALLTDSMQQPAPAVPDEMRFDAPRHLTGEYDCGHIDGWNACRNAMLAAAPTPPASDDADKRDEHLLSLGDLIRLYNEGYRAGHLDTVGRCYVHIDGEELWNYHSERVNWLLEEIFNNNHMGGK